MPRSSLDRHRDAKVEERFRILEQQGWTITLSRNKTYFEIACRNRWKRRISASDSKKARQQVAEYLAKHEEVHPGE